MNQLIKNSEKIELTGEDLHQMTNGECKILDYLDLERMENMAQVFGGKQAAILLFNTSSNVGHWVLLMRRGEGVVDHFDPYGFSIDQDINIASNQMVRNHQGALTPHLTALIQKGGFRVIENNKRLQKMLSDINTCGRWCVVRYLMADYPIEKFQKTMLNQKINPDEIVSYLTYLL